MWSGEEFKLFEVMAYCLAYNRSYTHLRRDFWEILSRKWGSESSFLVIVALGARDLGNDAAVCRSGQLLATLKHS